MRYLHILALLGAASVNAQITKCVADNCLRAIRASAFPGRSGTADCRSFFASYVSVTVTATVTSVHTDLASATTTVIEPVGVLPAKRQAGGQPSGIPAYASPCSGLARYSSACACVGVTESADAVTTTITISTSTTKTEVSTATITEFVMQLQNILPGNYVAKRGSPNEAYPRFTTDIAGAAVFKRLPDGQLERNGEILQSSPYSLYRDWIWAGGSTQLICNVDADKFLSCVSGEYEMMGVYIWSQDQNPYLAQGKAAADFEATGGGKVTIKVLPAPAPTVSAP
ncbi:hypothetical protein TWF730_001412 [Orbilia blumenaviensis]|uniref:Uncharacterized protein n=1 Tax=Orbilia blumenaviensis TaxID=1796055 RepID=A0AAV9UNU3_9PEZI